MTSTAGRLRSAIETFEGTLGRDQRRALRHRYTFEHAARWHTYPQWSLGRHGRLGVDLATLDGPQWTALMALVDVALGSGAGVGADAVRQHVAMDEHLRAIGMREGYGRTGFRVAVLGDPAGEGRWQLQLGGHHLAVTHTAEGDRIVGLTPSFRAIEPAAPVRFEGRLLDPMAVKTAALRALLAALDPDQREAADLGPALDDLLLGPGADWRFPDRPGGLAARDLDGPQRDLLVAAVRAFVADAPDEEAPLVLDAYVRELDGTRIGFRGSPGLRRIGDAVQIAGPAVWIELRMDEPYSTDQPHPHAVWRDRVTDYGGTRPGTG